MKKRTTNIPMSIVVGMAIGGVVGTAAAMMTAPKRSNLKKSANKALHSIGSLVNDVAGYIM